MTGRPARRGRFAHATLRDGRFSGAGAGRRTRCPVDVHELAIDERVDGHVCVAPPGVGHPVHLL
eukprot:5217229-Pleurochrysis_carterae.AAC.1